LCRGWPFHFNSSQNSQTLQTFLRDILRLMADGLVKKEIADVLQISVTTNTGAVAKALREKLIWGAPSKSPAGRCQSAVQVIENNS
jgi:FixJ family two-component response regulator